MSEKDNTFAEWVILELMGHRRLAGYLTEQDIAGKGFLRLEIPGDNGATQFYNPTAVYAITPTTEEIARRVQGDPAPVRYWELEPAASLSSQEAAEEQRAAAGVFDSEGPF